MILRISFTEGTPQASSVAGIKADVVGLMKPGFTIMVDVVTASNACWSVLGSGKEDFIHAAWACKIYIVLMNQPIGQTDNSKQS